MLRLGLEDYKGEFTAGQLCQNVVDVIIHTGVHGANALTTTFKSLSTFVYILVV